MARSLPRHAGVALQPTPPRRGGRCHPGSAASGGPAGCRGVRRVPALIRLVAGVRPRILVAAVLLAFGVPYALFLALFAAMAELIPMVGPVVGAVPAVIVAAALPVPTVIWVGVAFDFSQLIESNILVPRLVGKAVGIPSDRTDPRSRAWFPARRNHRRPLRRPARRPALGARFHRCPAWRDKRIELQEDCRSRHAAPPPGFAPAGPRQSGSRG